MAFRHIVITKDSHLALYQSNMRLIQENMKLDIPISDISTIYFEVGSSITTNLISELSKFNVLIFFCDEKSLPNAVCTAFQSHNQQLLRIQEQMNIPKVLEKNIWKQIIIMKIRNQAECLNLLSKYKDGDEVAFLNTLSTKVLSGDTSNVESRAAAYYFKKLFGDKFTRELHIKTNSTLNYGYSIVRGLVARSLVAYGFIPSIGIHHHNQYNNFNLADDFIECFRPVVDQYVYTEMLPFIVDQDDINLSSIERQLLQSIMIVDLEIDGKKQTLTNSVDIMVKSFATVIKSKDIDNIKLPKLISLKKHIYE